jgi:uncharacterized protein YjbJ (UPF0337 family)
MPGRMDEMKGAVKEHLGKATGNERMRSEGEAERVTNKAARESEGAVDQLKGNLKMGAGKLVGNDRLHAEGQADDLKGSVKKLG